MSASVHMKQIAGAKLDEVNKRLSAFADGGASIRSAVHNALGRAASRGRKSAPSVAASNYAISAGKASSHLSSRSRIEGGGGGVSGVYITFSGASIPLIEFENSPGAGGVRAHVKAANTGGEVGGSWYGHLPDMQIAKRISKPRFPVRILYGPSVPQMLGNESSSETLGDEIMSVFVERMDHEMTRILNGFL